jgi:hypothetical protein
MSPNATPPAGSGTKAPSTQDIVLSIPLLASLFATMSEPEANRALRGRQNDPVFLAVLARLRHWREERLGDLIAPPGPGASELTAEGRAYVAGECAALHTIEQGLILAACGNELPDTQAPA